MKRRGSATTALAILSASATPVDAFWRMSCGIIQTGRVDPVLSYDTVSQHVHKIAGASTININSTYDSLQESTCTSCSIQADKSAYWTPQLYFQTSAGLYEEVPNSGMTVYYLGRGTDPWGNATAAPFPEGLKMVSGNNNARTYDSETMTWGNSSYPARPVADRVSFVCIDYNNEVPQTTNMTDMNCPDGFRAQIQMQSCWDGENLYLEDQSHVAYLSQIDNGICPPTHPILLPHLFFEVFYSVTDFEGVNGTFVFANGDETGYAFHGDFINGWDIPTLTNAIDECLIGNTDGVVEDCSAFDASNIENYATVCPETSPIWPCEAVHGTLESLPGCITPTGYGHIETSADNTCPGGNVVACSPNHENKAPSAYPGNSAWSAMGCYTEATNSRALKSASYTSTTNMTAESCLAFCSGYTYSGVEYGQECYCGNAIQAGSNLTASTDCDMSCTGNQWETCGAGVRLQMFQAVNTTSSSSSSSIVSSITTSSQSTMPISTSSVSTQSTLSTKSSSSSKITSSSPSSSGTSSSSTAVSSQPTLSTKSSSISKTSSSSSSSSKATSSQSTMSTKYSSTSKTSSTSSSSSSSSTTRSSQITLSTKYPEIKKVSNYTFMGCYSDNVSARALQNATMYGSYQGSPALTLELCAAYCTTATGGPYKYFGVEYTNECFCGNTIMGGNYMAPNQDDCSSQCPGNTTEYCGSGNRLNLFSLSTATGTSTTAAATATGLTSNSRVGRHRVI